MAELTPSDYAYLIILRAEGREVSNTELRDRHDVRLVSPHYEKLNGEGLVASETKRRPYRHIITAKGRAILGEPIVADDDEKRSAKERLLWAALMASQKGDVRAPTWEPVVAPEEPVDLAGRIRAAYAELTPAPGEWVALTEIRPRFGDVSKSELDKALEHLLESNDVRLEPDQITHRGGAEGRKAAVHIGGEDRHKLAIGQR